MAQTSQGKSTVFTLADGYLKRNQIVHGEYDSPQEALNVALEKLDQDDNLQEVAINSKSKDGEYLDVIVISRHKKQTPINWKKLIPWRRK